MADATVPLEPKELLHDMAASDVRHSLHGIGGLKADDVRRDSTVERIMMTSVSILMLMSMRSDDVSRDSNVRGILMTSPT